MADEQLYEPSKSKRMRSCDGYSSSPSYSELSSNEDNQKYSLRRKKQHLTPIKSRLRNRTPLEYVYESVDNVDNVVETVDGSNHVERRVTRSCNSEPKEELPLIPLGSNLVISISDSDSTKGTLELLVHLLVDSNLSVPSKSDILTPNFTPLTTILNDISHDTIEDISDSSYLHRHKKKELFEKKAKNRAHEVYRHELHSKMLRKSFGGSLDSQSIQLSRSTEKNVQTDETWYKDLLENKDKPLFRIGVFNGQELWGVDQDGLEKLIKSKDIQSDYLPVNTPIDTETNIPLKKSRSARKKVSR